MGEVAQLLTAIAAMIAAVGTILVTRQVRGVNRQVRTLNESTIGELLAAVETRRVGNIPHDERTAKEERHLDDSPKPGPAQGPEKIA